MDQYIIMKYPFIESVKIPQEIRVEEPFSIGIQGNWPNPTWKHNQTKIDIDTSKREVSVEYLGISGGGMAIQVLQPFTDSIEIKLPKDGKWVVKIKNRADDIKIKLDVH